MSEATLSETRMSETETRRHDRRVAWSVVAVIVGTVLVGGLVPAPAPHPVPPAPSRLSPSQDVNCAEWGDGCHVCRRVDGAVACSLPGIACLPTKVSCRRRVTG